MYPAQTFNDPDDHTRLSRYLSPSARGALLTTPATAGMEPVNFLSYNPLVIYSRNVVRTYEDKRVPLSLYNHLNIYYTADAPPKTLSEYIRFFNLQSAIELVKSEIASIFGGGEINESMAIDPENPEDIQLELKVHTTNLSANDAVRLEGELFDRLYDLPEFAVPLEHLFISAV